MIDSGNRRGAANLAPILMVVAFAAILGFLFWLGATSEGTEVVAMNEANRAEEPADPLVDMATELTQTRIQNPGEWLGEVVKLTTGNASRLGDQAYLTTTQPPLLVMMDSALVAGGQQIPAEESLVVGTLREVTDSVADAWVAAGRLPEAERGTVDFVSHYIEAARIRPAPAEAPVADTAAAGDATAAEGAAGAGN